MDKTMFLNLIEEYYGFQLNRPQLQFFYSSGMNTVMSGPRRCGKDFVALMDCLHTCTTPRKHTMLVVPTTTLNRMLQLFNDMINAFRGHMEVERIIRNGSVTILFTNKSELMILSLRDIDGDCRGRKTNKAIIVEPDFINVNNIEDLVLRIHSCMCIYPDAQLKIIGTHGISKHNLMAYMMHPYFEKITASYKDIVGEDYSYLDLQNLEESMDATTYQLEIMNMITPTMLNEMFIN